nr:hypothetical protein [Tanacetum cinerariifolium]
MSSVYKYQDPTSRNLVPVEHEDITSIGKSDGIKFQVVSYNILEQSLATSRIFPHSPSPCLVKETRMPVILDVLKSLNADILCLQELDEYKRLYKKKVEHNGYSSIYIKRSRNKQDGCGIFYKHNKLELVMEDRIEYNDLTQMMLYDLARIELIRKALDTDNKGHGQNSNDHGLLYFSLKRDNVGIMAAFKFKKPCQHYELPEWAIVKLAQAKYFLSRVARFMKMVSEKFMCTPSVLIAGDFNSVPESEIYKPTNNNLRTSSNTSRANQDNSPRIHRNAGYEGQRSGTVAEARDTVGSSMVQKSGIQCYNCKEYGHIARVCQKPKRAKDAAYHREKMLLCKQEEAGIQLNAEQADWRDDTDDESDDQELEAHYMYMAKLQ